MDVSAPFPARSMPVIVCRARVPLTIARPYSIENSYDTITWERMTAVKSRILRMWDNANPSIRICCIKFAQRVVLAQSAASPSEHRVNPTNCLGLSVHVRSSQYLAN